MSFDRNKILLISKRSFPSQITPTIVPFLRIKRVFNVYAVNEIFNRQSQFMQYLFSYHLFEQPTRMFLSSFVFVFVFFEPKVRSLFCHKTKNSENWIRKRILYYINLFFYTSGTCVTIKTYLGICGVDCAIKRFVSVSPVLFRKDWGSSLIEVGVFFRRPNEW